MSKKWEFIHRKSKVDGRYRGVEPEFEFDEEDITATETPRALIESRAPGKPKAKRSGEYLAADFTAALRASKK